MYLLTSFFSYVSPLQLQEVFGWFGMTRKRGLITFLCSSKTETCVFGWGIAILNISLPNCHEKNDLKSCVNSVCA